MPLSPPTDREHIHTRRVTCQGFRRADGLWDIEGRITDVKTYPFANDYRGAIQPGDPIHDMSIRLTVDDHFEIKAVEAVTDKSPFAVCPAITPNFQRLVGLSMKSGWTRKVKELLGGVEGCTHLLTLVLAASNHRVVSQYLLTRVDDGSHPEGTPDFEQITDTCSGWREGGTGIRLVRKGRPFPRHVDAPPEGTCQHMTNASPYFGSSGSTSMARCPTRCA